MSARHSKLQSVAIYHDIYIQCAAKKNSSRPLGPRESNACSSPGRYEFEPGNPAKQSKEIVLES